MKKLIIALIALSSMPTLVACNTVEGIGKDVGAAGDAVAKEAREAKN